MKLCYHCMHQIENGKAQTCPNCGRSLARQPVSGKYLQPGTVLQGKFLIGYPLGAGGFGNTYIGWNQKLFGKVAVKEFYPEQYCRRGADGASVTVAEERQQARFEAGLGRFLEEARSVAALQDIPGVVKIFNFFEENGTGYIVMEYLEGMDVKAILARSGNKKDYKWCRRVTLTVLHTLREIHKRGVLHRDIAPDNVFVTREGIIKLIDFGAARHLAALADTPGEIMLKAGYAPIEQYGRDAPQGPYTDLYAVAALFYRMLTGQKPIPANERLNQDALILPSEMGVKIPQQAEMGMMVCLNVQPQYRLQSADEFMEALDGLDFTPVYEPEWILPPPEDEKGIGKRIARLPALARAGVCLGCICLAGLALFGIVRFRGRGGEEAGLADGTVVMNDLSGMTREEALASLGELEEKARAAGITLDIDLETKGFVFDLDPAKEGTIVSQTLKASAVLYDPDAESQAAIEGFTRDGDGNVSGTVTCSLYSSKKLHYKDISGLNVYAMARKLGIDPEDTEHFIGTDEAPDSRYYDLIRLETPDGEISAKNLKKKKWQNKAIAYDRDKMCIIYSNNPFFYWESLPDFKKAYGTLEKIPAQDTYIWKNENKREATGDQRRLEEVSGLVDVSYCVIHATKDSGEFRMGSVISQNRPSGGELDTSGMEPSEVLLAVVGCEVLYSGKTGDQLKAELAEQFGESVQVVAGGSQTMSQSVLSVAVTDAKGKKATYFRKGEAVTATLDLRAVPTPEPVQESAAAPEPVPETYVQPEAQAPAAPAWEDVPADEPADDYSEGGYTIGDYIEDYLYDYADEGGESSGSSGDEAFILF